MFTLQKTFRNLKLSLLTLGAGLILLTVELFHLSQYADRFSALKHQHELIEKITQTDLDDPQMAAILINGATSEISLAVKKTESQALLDLFLVDGNEQATLLDELHLSSKAFRNSAIIWSESLQVSRASAYDTMLKHQTRYQHDLNAMIIHHAELLDQSIRLTQYTLLTLLPLFLILFFFFGYRLNQISFDIKQAGSVEIDATPKEIKTKEIDFLIKRLSRKATTNPSNVNPILLHPQSGLLNEKGMLNAFNVKRSNTAANTLFVALFDIDQYTLTSKELSKEEQAGIYRKLGEIISMYEQPNDVIAQLDNDRFVFLISRNSKDTALDEIQKIVDSVKDSTFLSAKGPLKLTISAGFLLKAPVKSLDEIIADAGKLLHLAQDSGGNRVTQMRHRNDSYN